MVLGGRNVTKVVGAVPVIVVLGEAQNYYVDQQGRFSDPDDCIDSARYALLGCLNGWAEPWDGLTPQQRMADARDILMRPRSQDERPAWKRTYSTQ